MNNTIKTDVLIAGCGCSGLYMAMNGEERRNQIVDILKHSSSPVPGTQLAQILDVSRQVIVQDIALIRAKNIDVFSTNRGYVLNDKQEYSRILKVKHEDDEVEAELGAIVDMGGWIRADILSPVSSLRYPSGELIAVPT
jgi:transcriptional regulator of NAD metabolism